MRQFLIETHMHTAETSFCGKVPARQGIRIYKELGYDGVCITDHFCDLFSIVLDLCHGRRKSTYFSRARTTKDEGLKTGIKVMLGMEYAFPGTNDDMLIYGFDEDFLYSNENMHLLNKEELKKLASENNLLLIQAHPFRKRVSRTYDDIVDGFEGFNGHPGHESMNDKAYRHALDFGGIIISGSDFHREGEGGTGGIYLNELPENSFELADILRQIKTPLMRKINMKRVENKIG